MDIIIKIEKIGLCLAGGLGLTSQPLTADNLISKKNKSPHIILIMTDQQRADALGCAGNKAVISPNIDRLAAEGHLFRNAYSASPSSTPARAGLLTGMSPWHHGLLGYGQVAERYPYEMPQMLKELGYHALGIGKMHWYPQNVLHGFEVTIIDESGRVESPYFMSDYRKWFATQAFGMNPDSTGVEWNAHGAKTYALPERLHPTVWTGDRAVEAIKGYTSEQPLFLKVSFARPHSPYDPPQRVLDMYEGKNIPIPVVGNWCEKLPEDPHPERTPEAYNGNFGIEYAQNSRKYYYAAITFIDEQVGRIIDELKKKGMYDNALICFVSDHGDLLGDHYLWRKTYAYEGSAAIPYIVKLPHFCKQVKKAGTPIDEPVELRDLLPTFLAVNGAEISKAIDGMSLLPLMEEKKASWRRFIDIEHAETYWHNNYWCALTDGKIKYIWFFHSGEEQLFDLTKDPGEINDLSKDPSSQKQLKLMRKAMAEHLEERGEEWMKDGELIVRDKSLLYSPNYPTIKRR